jgi:hypothetical protein
MTSPKRLLAPLAVLVALLALPAGAQAKYTLGVSDQQASTFTNRLFKPLKLKTARYIAPYDVMSSPVDHRNMDAWLRAARTAKVRVLVSFQHSRQRRKERRLPSTTEYRRAITAFHKAYPWVREISPWNEVNRCQTRKDPAGQPTCGKEKRLAQYYSLTRKVFGKRTTVVALDVLDEANVGKTLKVIRKFLRYAKPRPKILGFHNYSDTNRFSTTRTQAVLRTWKKDVWLTETGGIVRLGRSFKYSTKRAAKALGCMFTIARKYKRVKRLYVYQFNGERKGARFDAGLIDPKNKKRAGYKVVQKRKARRCHK